MTWSPVAGVSSANERWATPARSTRTRPGCLLVGLGQVTRLLRFLSGLPKRYSGEVVLGVATSTLDASGEVTGTWDMRAVTLEAARSAAAKLTGEMSRCPRWSRP